jgi:predicted ester cyclase
MPEAEVTNLDEYAQFLQETAAMFPDYWFTPQMVVAEGDYVAWYGVFSGTFAENGNSLEVLLAGFFRYEAGKIAEVWTEWDNVTWGAQMNEGAPPPPIAGYEPPVSGEFDLEANTALFEAFAEAELTRDYDRFDELFADDFVRHSSATPDVQVESREAFKAFLQATAEEFPDYTNTAQMIVAEGDLVALYTNMSGTFAPTGQEVEFPHIDFFRIEGGKIAELWVEWDNLSLMTQMGVLPPPEPVEETISTPTPEAMTYYITVGTANVRECPRTDCARVTTFSYGDALDVIGTVEGENTLGSNQWREVRYQDQIVYVHSALTSLVRNLALGMTARASRSYRNDLPANAVDGNLERTWGAGAPPPQWVEIALGEPVTMFQLRLVTAQTPSGRTRHQIWVGPTAEDLYLLHTFEGFTFDNQTLVFSPDAPVEDVRYVRVVTLSSPSWVGWREIEIHGIEALSAPTLDTSITIPGDVNWLDSGIWVNVGDTFTISASGEVNPCVDHPEVAVCYPHSAAGLTEVGTVALGDPERAGNYPMPGGTMAAVVGRIGQEQPFEVGTGGTFTASHDGMLQFRINDEPLNNNQGAFTLRVIVYP